MPESKPRINSSFPESTDAPAGSFRLADFEYDLPAELIAQEPLAARDQSRLMLLDRKSESISHRHFYDLPDLLAGGDLLVINDTRVIPARLLARRATGGLIELLLLRPETAQPGFWHAMANGLRKLKEGEVLYVGCADEPVRAPVVIERIIAGPDGQKRLLVNLGSPEQAYRLLAGRGYAPLPPYIRRNGDRTKRQQDLERYQTVFASAPGAVAAPTAGLHFSNQLLERLQERGIETCEITLHVGPGTFKPITTSIEDHTIESEPFTVSRASADKVNAALADGRRVIAVGTTSLRTLETAGAGGRLLESIDASTSLYIRPGYRFRVTQGLITNFHLSRSSLLVLVSTFAGHDLTMRAYKEAVAVRYRFFSYGDCMLIL